MKTDTELARPKMFRRSRHYDNNYKQVNPKIIKAIEGVFLVTFYTHNNNCNALPEIKKKKVKHVIEISDGLH